MARTKRSAVDELTESIWDSMGLRSGFSGASGQQQQQQQQPAYGTFTKIVEQQQPKAARTKGYAPRAANE